VEKIGDLIEKMRQTPEQDESWRRRREEDAQREQARERCQKWDAFKGKIGKRYADCRFENFESDPARDSAVSTLRAFAGSFKSHLDQGSGVLLLGPRGTGKDHLAVAAVHEAIKASNVHADWVDGQSLFSEMRDRISNEETEGRRIRELVSPAILLISDPVPQDGKLSDYQQSILWQIIDGRYRQMRSTWVTANATSESELSSKMGAQIVDRIVGGATVILTTGWKSFRAPRQIVKA
jgi:DNA replication protein DnaC